MRGLRWASGVAIALTYAVIVLGALVRATGSGLSCPDWPTCYGHWVPLPGEIPESAGYGYFQVMLEWVHRLLAGFVLGPLVVLIGGLAWRARRRSPRMPLYAAALEGRREHVVGHPSEHDGAAHGHHREQRGAHDRDRERSALRLHRVPEQARAAAHDRSAPVTLAHVGRT